MHHRLRYHGTNAQQECGIAGDHFRSGKGRHKADDRIFLRDRTFLDHLPDLLTRSDTAHIASLVGFAFKAVVIGRDCLTAHIHIGRLAELRVRILGCQLHHQLAVAVKENDVTALICQFSERLLHLIIQHVTAG